MTTDDPTQPHICATPAPALAAENARLRSQLAEARAELRQARIDAMNAHDLAAAQTLRRERDQARTVLAEARQQRDQAAEALIQAETERDEAWDRLSTLVDELAGALEMSGTPDDHEIIREARAFGQLRVELSALRAEREWLADQARTMGIADATIATYGPAHAVSAEAGRLRAEVKRLSARVREWEAVHADLAARCDSGDIPIRLGERYSLAVLREIDRLRAERDRLRRRLGDVLDLEELPEDHTIVAAVRRLRAEAGRLRDERDSLRAVYEPLLAQVTDWHARLRAMWLPAAMGAVADLREEMGAALRSAKPTTGSTEPTTEEADRG